MSKDQYVQFFASAPARFLLIVAAIAGGGASLHLVPAVDGDFGAVQRELQACLGNLDDARDLAERYETDNAEIAAWAKGAVDALPEIQRVEALGRAPESYIYASGVGSQVGAGVAR